MEFFALAPFAFRLRPESGGAGKERVGHIHASARISSAFVMQQSQKIRSSHYRGLMFIRRSYFLHVELGWLSSNLTPHLRGVVPRPLVGVKRHDVGQDGHESPPPG